MRTYHIHISGLVQGVGFRPLVCRKAESFGIDGWVCNGTDGVHIRFNSNEETAEAFYRDVIKSAPEHSILTHHDLAASEPETFSGFSIRQSINEKEPDVLLTPDLATCPDCRKELTQKGNRREGYLFTTCLHCGPRYSLIRELPYDREHTTMRDLAMCPDCGREYNDIHDRRHYSQTNSCPACAIALHLFDAPDSECASDPSTVLDKLRLEILNGGVVAVKGTGGYLLIADATNADAIRHLRQKKHRPAKPLALLYRDRKMIEGDAHVCGKEWDALYSAASPIVLCRIQEKVASGMRADLVAPGLDKIGILVPHTPLLQGIADLMDRPLVCTSANLSGSPIIYVDVLARKALFRFASLVLTYDRDILVPQDDSVVQFTGTGRRIILRRSRGMAPNHFPQALGNADRSVLAMGADMKSAFAIHHRNKVFISQYLGNQAEYNSQESYAHTLAHLKRLLQVSPAVILSDAHPGYHVTETGRALAENTGANLQTCQHHRAHFAAVLAENRLLHSSTPVLGFIWDGTGYGDDGQVWGGETFLYRNGLMDRVAHLDTFPQLLGDKMSLEPRLSALSLLREFPAGMARIEKHFSEKEWTLYQQPGFWKQATLRTSSMGRLLDGISLLLTGCALSRYEGEAAMLLETLARSCTRPTEAIYPLPLLEGRIAWQVMMEGILTDLSEGEENSVMAHKVFRSLAHAVSRIGAHFRTERIAFSGGVFQNALLTDMIMEALQGRHESFFHLQLSPNDENIAYGQLALHHLEQEQGTAGRHDIRNILKPSHPETLKS
jgi:hydrogenase maturation protein HypF